MDTPRARRIWHFETEPLCDALNEAGAWQTAVRIRVSHEEALRHRPEGTAFDVRPTPEDVAPLNLALDTLRAERAREGRLSWRLDQRKTRDMAAGDDWKAGHAGAVKSDAPLSDRPTDRGFEPKLERGRGIQRAHWPASGGRDTHDPRARRPYRSRRA